MEFEPLTDKILLTRTAAEEVTKGGIIIPDTAKEKQNTGKVISVGGDVKGVKKGDVILFPKHIGIDIKVGDEDLTIVAEKEVIGICH